MNKAQFIKSLVPHFNDSKKEATHAVEIVIDAITRNMAKGEDVSIAGFGKFRKIQRKARVARNPFTGEPVKVKAKTVARFTPAKVLKEIVAGTRKMEPAPKPAPKVVAKAAPKKAAKKAAPKKAAKKAAKKAPKKAAKKVAKKWKRALPPRQIFLIHRRAVPLLELLLGFVLERSSSAHCSSRWPSEIGEALRTFRKAAPSSASLITSRISTP
jgi:DNA-binding protein HU-beta